MRLPIGKRGSYCRRRRGVAAVWMALMGIILAGLFAFALSSARTHYSFHQLQVAADAAALAALDKLPSDLRVAGNMQAAQQHAADVANQNLCDGSGVGLQVTTNNSSANDIYYGQYNFVSNTFTVTTNPPINAVHVSARRIEARNNAVKFFLPLPNTKNASTDQVASATAVLVAPQPGLFLLDPSASPALEMKGNNNNQLTVLNGDILVNSSATGAASIHGVIQAANIDIVGTVITQGQTTTPNIVTLKQSLADPLAVANFDIPAPTGNPSIDYAGYGGDRTPSANTDDPLRPGYYGNGLPARNVALKEGVYILDGQWMDNRGFYTSLPGQGVVLYLLPPPAASGRRPAVQFPAGLKITAPTSASTSPASSFANLAIYQQRTGASLVEVTINGTPDYIVTGTIYMPFTIHDAAGNFGTFGNEVILDQLHFTGSTTLTINSMDLFPVLGTQRTIINTVRTNFQ